jgi:alpha-glucosidase (family GH31 glycosyl hydrolase)
VYLDYAYLKAESNFQVDTTAFPDLIGLGKTLHDQNQKLVVILDSVISAEDKTDTFYQQGDTNKVFIKTAIHNNTDYNGNLITYRAGTESSKIVLVDWFNDQCADIYKAGINQISQFVPFDGVWLNQNEPTTATPGEVSMDPPPTPPTPPTSETTQRFLLGDENYGWYHSFPQDDEHKGTFFLPFVPLYYGEDNTFGNFDKNTVSLNATHTSNKGTEYNLHNLYGHMQAKRIYDVLSDKKYPISKNRPFILSRSTFASSGRYASHWLGDTPRDWNFMKYTIAGIQSMNMFGIPHVGADVCGFKGNSRDDEMCARWIQLSTFYPLARSN